jgi:hypothetical protein
LRPGDDVQQQQLKQQQPHPAPEQERLPAETLEGAFGAARRFIKQLLGDLEVSTTRRWLTMQCAIHTPL